MSRPTPSCPGRQGQADEVSYEAGGAGAGQVWARGKALPLGEGGVTPRYLHHPHSQHILPLSSPPTHTHTLPHLLRSQPQGLSGLLSPTRIKMDQETWQV